MSANSPLAPAALPALEAAPGTLEYRIRLAEQRLVAREVKLRAGWCAFGERVQRATEPRRLLLPALAGAMSLLAMWWAARGARGPRPELADRVLASAQARAGGGPRWAELPWARAAAIVWPLLPAAWRARVSPGTAQLAVAMGVPLAQHLTTRSQPVPLSTVASVDLSRYAGTWYVVAELPAALQPACRGQRSMSYRLTSTPGTLDLLNRCRDAASALLLDERGTARTVPGSAGARLDVSLLAPWLRWLPFACAEHAVLYLDADYSVAMLGDPERAFLRILSRRTTLDDATLQGLVQRAREQGFAVDRLVYGAPG